MYNALDFQGQEEVGIMHQCTLYNPYDDTLFIFYFQIQKSWYQSL